MRRGDWAPPTSPSPAARIPIRVLVAIAAATAVVLAAAAAVGALDDRSLGDLTRDPLTVARDATETYLPAYIGALSNLGIVLLAVATGAALVGAIVLRGDRETAWFLGAGAAVTTLFLVDDLFQGHEWLGRRDVPDAVSYGLLALLFGLFLYRNRALVLRLTFWPLIVAAGVAFGVSIAVDANLVIEDYFLEDSLKFAGIVAWSTWLVAASASLLGSRIGAGPERRSGGG
jgi:hypothetical protein